MRQADAPLQKITINIYKSDYDYIKAVAGDQYSVRIRDMIHKEVIKHRSQGADYERG